MQWYYVENGQQTGPVEESQLPELWQSGRLLADTLVWHEGMSGWQAFHTVAPPAMASAIIAAPAASAPTTGGAASTTDEAVCAECGRMFNKNDMIPHGNVHICANCKPVFMQKLAEGARINTGALNYASIGLRFGALIIDGVLLWVVNFVISLAFGLTMAQAAGAEPATAIALQVVLMLIQIAIGLSYETILVGKYGATLGKMACRIKVVTADGGRVTYLRALGRYFAKALSGAICLIGYIMALFDKEEKRALHDRICNTRVVMK